MKKALLILLSCLFAALPGRSQLAALIDSTVLHSRLFTDGTGLYELQSDTLYSVNTGTGSRTVLQKLPAPPIAGATSVTWSNPIKTATGFLVQQRYDYNGYRYALWGYNGSRWDTLMSGYDGYISQIPIQVGTSYVFDFTGASALPLSDRTLVKTDGSRAGTQVVFRPASQMLNYGTYTMYYGPEYADSTRQLFFELDFTDTTSVTRIRTRLFRLDGTGVSLVDSCNYSTNYLGVVNNDVYYYYQNDTLIPGTTTRAFIPRVKKRNLSTGIISTFKTLPQQTFYARGTVFSNRLIVTKYAPAPYDSLLVSVDPATGTETDLIDSFSSVSIALHSTGHLYFPTSSRNATIQISDGRTGAGSLTKYQRVILYTPILSRYPLDVAPTATCGDDWYFPETQITTGTPVSRINEQKLFRLRSTGQVDSQAFVGNKGRRPTNFVNVGGTVYYNAGGSLWKITGCTASASVTQTSQSATAILYPNPARTAVTIVLGSGLSAAHLELYDAMGRQVLRQTVQNGQVFPVTDLPTGLYLYRLLQPGEALIHTGRLSVLH